MLKRIKKLNKKERKFMVAELSYIWGMKILLILLALSAWALTVVLYYGWWYYYTTWDAVRYIGTMPFVNGMSGLIIFGTYDDIYKKIFDCWEKQLAKKARKISRG